jgi:hypothetical protein
MNIDTQTITSVRARPAEFLEPSGSFTEFVTRFGVIDVLNAEGRILWKDVPSDVDLNAVWTVVESNRDDEVLLVPGIRWFDRIGYVVAEKLRADNANQYRTYSFED